MLYTGYIEASLHSVADIEYVIPYILSHYVRPVPGTRASSRLAPGRTCTSEHYRNMFPHFERELFEDRQGRKDAVGEGAPLAIQTLRHRRAFDGAFQAAAECLALQEGVDGPYDNFEPTEVGMGPESLVEETFLHRLSAAGR